MNKFRDKLQNFMDGRYGVDQLGRFTMFAALASIIVSFFVAGLIFSTIAILLLVWSYYRMFSRNHAKRWAENERFLGFWNRFLGFFRGLFRPLRDREHRYFRCPALQKTAAGAHGAREIFPSTVLGAIRILSGIPDSEERLCSDILQ